MSFEEYLEASLQGLPASRTRQAMAYSLMAGGKRVRPGLILAALEDYGLDPKKGYGPAAALEMIHTYSLIHDDLPAMDNDDLRRGRPSCHKAFDESTAILAGDGLLTQAFSHLAHLDLPADQIVALSRILADCAGAAGMVYGQDLDLKFENETNTTLDDLLEIDTYKTARLLMAALSMAAVVADHPEDLEAMAEIGRLLGLQFQIVDDILDVQSSEEAMGKSLSDAANHKSTAVSLLGLDQAIAMAGSYEQQIQDLVQSLHLKPNKLSQLIADLSRRQS